MSESITLLWVTTHNLRNIDVSFQKNTLTVVTGVSGSGKSSLAFTTLCNEGQRRYLESLSTYARMFIGGMSEEAKVREISGLTPTISIEQKTVAHNPRSTVGTITEIYDFYRLLFLSLGTRMCPQDNVPMIKKTHTDVIQYIQSLPNGTRIGICAQIRHSFDTAEALRDFVGQKWFVRYMVDSVVYNLSDEPPKAPFLKGDVRLGGQGDLWNQDLSKNPQSRTSTAPLQRSLQTPWIVVDRVEIDTSDTTQLDRLSQSISTAFEHGEDVVWIYRFEEKSDEWRVTRKSRKSYLGTRNSELGTHTRMEIFSRAFRCPHCGYVPPELTLSHFSFNSPAGACVHCHGLGSLLSFTEASVIDPEKTLEDGAVMPWGQDSYYHFVLMGACKHHRIPVDIVYNKLKKEHKKLVLNGSDVRLSLSTLQMQKPWNAKYPGIIPYLNRVYHDPETSDALHEKIDPFVIATVCPVCSGYRVGEQARHVLIKSSKKKEKRKKKKEGIRHGEQVIGLNSELGTRNSSLPPGSDNRWNELNELNPSNEAVTYHIGQLAELSVEKSVVFFQGLTFNTEDTKVATNMVKNITDRLKFLQGVWLGYMTLSRRSNTLSGGESQRIRLATQVGTKLEGITYVLDEPSIGLHPRDSRLLINNLRELVNLWNTVIVVEHDEEVMRQSDQIIDIGPGAGVHGGNIIFQGTYQQILSSKTETGAYLRGEKNIHIPPLKHKITHYLKMENARENNLKNISVDIPLGALTVVTGVSGSGKSSLINRTLAPAMRNLLHRTRDSHGKVSAITGFEELDKVVIIDQMPIGKTPRSNPATYTGVFTEIRDVFAQTLEARARGYKAGHFSFNTKQGRCDACEGDGVKKIQMHFLPDVHVTCESCGGSRYNHLVREVHFHDTSISDVLAMTVEDAVHFFAKFPKIRHRLQTLLDVGLGYITLGQSALTLSGGESQRVKLATELARKATGKTLYIMDEPTTGLHFSDIQRLMLIVSSLVERGNTLLVIEHHLDVIANAHYLIDLGPEGGDGGGQLLYQWPRDGILKAPESYTGKCLAEYLEHKKKQK